ncbi:MAG: hypothetical protein N0A16_12695 [Blastocatellia bacterium]|nr:hypothetical protein [Blastocatellia bacterium]MCS7158570.1 hypothetical protein [Blastocatellia bacterium]MDW8169304.1 hypothetical protein [Acidobacteriota bacterium]MDW8257766.1 hypothetical protein [Acidobacteriota bacterium]
MPSKPRIEFQVGDEVMYAGAASVRYGTIIRVIGAGNAQMVEVEFEDGKRELKKASDRALRLLRRKVAEDVRPEIRDREVEEVRRSETRRR